MIIISNRYPVPEIGFLSTLVEFRFECVNEAIIRRLPIQFYSYHSCCFISKDSSILLGQLRQNCIQFLIHRLTVNLRIRFSYRGYYCVTVIQLSSNILVPHLTTSLSPHDTKTSFNFVSYGGRRVKTFFLTTSNIFNVI